MSNLGGIADLTSAIEFDRNWRLVGGESIDIFNIGPVGESSLATDDIQVYGNGGADILNIHGGPNERGMSISASQVTWYGDGRPGSVYGGSLTYDSVAALNVTGTGFISYMYNPTTARYVISGPFPNTLVTIDGGGEMDTLVVPTTANTWSLATHADSRVNNVTFKNFECLEGGSLGDTFRFAGWTSWWQSIDGGGGLDSLDYSQHPIGVSVDLASGTGVGVNQVFRIENVTGSPFADTLRGDAAANVLNGLGGNDLIEGRDGANIIDGGDGNDTLTAGSGNDLFRAGSGNDRVTAGGGDDIAYGAAGNDNIDGGDGNDAIFGQADKDALQGGLGRDILFGGTGIDLLNGGAGDDILSSGDFLNDLIISRVDAIRAEWTSNHTYSDRVANLRGNAAGSTTYASRLNGNIFLTTMGASPSVILSLVAEDSLTGGSTTPSDPNQDWFFGRTAELIDRKSNESVN
jgi:Ca2+-binding RTX toxin-like protein